ncbi:flagellar biosynthesis protein flip [Peptococcaceae bacterium SCADC1_2_3]|nr:flagellar biosynthesis protein flip [Peptococcaceae bacterium SCADC1_2_3]
MKFYRRKRSFIFSVLILCFIVCFFLYLPPEGNAQPIPVPDINIRVGQAATPQQTVDSVKLLVLLALLSLLPAFLVILTSFTRIIVVLSILRSALGTQQTPPNQVLIGLALFLTIFIMAPVYQEIDRQAIKPYLANNLNQEQAFTAAEVPLRSFMLKQTREKDLALFVNLAKIERPRNQQTVPMRVVIPSFIISELKTAFQIGFLLYMPFLIIDMVVAAILMSMGMFMLPPIMISLPFKLLLFVMIDGWYLVIKSLMETFR